MSPCMVPLACPPTVAGGRAPSRSPLALGLALFGLGHDAVGVAQAAVDVVFAEVALFHTLEDESVAADVQDALGGTSFGVGVVFAKVALFTSSW